MWTFAILIGLIFLCAVYLNRNTYGDFEIPVVLVIILAAIYLIFHSVGMAIKSYEYEVWLEERQAFVHTLNAARENGREYEAASIVKDIADWNTKLARYKYKNNTLFFDQYIDDRVENLKPIE